MTDTRLARAALSALVAASLALAACQTDGSNQTGNSKPCDATPCRPNGAPYVADNGAIVIYPGEQLVIALETEDGKIVKAQPAPAGGTSSDTVEVSFKQIDSGMMLTVANNMSKQVKYDATIKARDGRMVYTSSCPVDAGLSNFESWPDPITFLELSNFRFQDGDSCE